MDQQHTPEQPEQVDGQKSLGQTTESNFSLPVRSIHSQPSQEDRHPSTDNHGVLSDNLQERKTEFGATFIKRYVPLKLGSTTWKCKVCRSKATQLIHATASLPPDLEFSGSTIGDKLIPTCQKEGCQTQANAIAESFFQNGSPNSQRMDCESCGRDSKMRLCAACRFTREWGFWHRVRIISNLEPQTVEKSQSRVTARESEPRLR